MASGSPGHGEGQPGEDLVLISVDLGAEAGEAAGHFRQSVVVGVGILHDQPGEPVRMPVGQAHPDRPTKVEDVCHEPGQG